MRLTQQQVEEGLRLMGLSMADIQWPTRSGNLEEAKQRLVALKAKAKTGFRRAAMDLHPDRTGGDEAKSELFRVVCALNDDIEKLEMQDRSTPPPRPPMRVHVHVQHRGGSGQTSSTSSTAGDVWGFWVG